MPRFLLVLGKPDVLCPNPHALGHNPARYAGRRLRSGDVPKGTPYLGHFEPVEEVLLDHEALRSACKVGDLTLLRECVAAGHDEARRLLAPPAPAPIPNKAPIGAEVK